jgi:hypothetical protein
MLVNYTTHHLSEWQAQNTVFEHCRLPDANWQGTRLTDVRMTTIATNAFQVSDTVETLHWRRITMSLTMGCVRPDPHFLFIDVLGNYARNKATSEMRARP